MIPPNFASIREIYRVLCEDRGSDALGRLTYMLRAGGLKAFYFSKSSEQIELGPDFWQSSNDDTRLRIFKSGFKDAPIPGTDVIEVVVPISETGLDAPQVEERSTTNRGGRYDKYDRDAIWCGIAWIVYTEGLPTSKDAFIERVQLWCTANFGKDAEPSRSVLQPMVGRVVATIENMEPAIVFPDFMKTKKRSRKKR